MQRIQLPNGKEIRFNVASPADIPSIISLYHTVYKGSYTLKEVQIPEIILKKIENPDYFWLLAQEGERVVGSVIFAIDQLNKIGKCYAAVVLPELRGLDVMRTMVRQGLERLTQRTRVCDVIYATTRTVSVAPQVVLEHLNFHSMGIFPNVRKVKSFETHGLEVFVRDGSLPLRRDPPRLISEVVDIYKIVREVLNLGPHEEVLLPLSDPRSMGEPIPFVVNNDESAVLDLFDRYSRRHIMEQTFFPFVEPNLLFTSEQVGSEIFVNFNETDGNGVIVGYRIKSGIQNEDFRRVLMWFCDAAERAGMRYIESLVSAYQPEFQRITVDARFLPCAYFPAMRWTEENRREDYIVFSRSFERLDFMDLHLVDTNRRYLDAFMKAWYEMLVRCQPDFDEEWRLG